MNNCESINLIAYLEGEDTGEETSLHLKECEKCQKKLSDYKILTASLMRWQQGNKNQCERLNATLEASVGETAADMDHINSCAECNDLFKTISQAYNDVQILDTDKMEPLPEKIQELITLRKKNWLAKRLKKVLRFQGVEGKKQSDEIKKLLEQDLSSLPLAAFPDDLLDDEEDENDD